jgi:protein-L-isoaspartate(D-aspartate) O-methyltransferase
MVREQIESRGIRDPRVLAAMRAIPRHLFVPAERRSSAYSDIPLLIGFGQTISQPYMVALMTELLRFEGSEKVLDVGTGSGYQAAILSKLAASVISIEYIPELAERARRMLDELSINNVDIRVGDGSSGLPQEAPFDAIVVGAGAPSLPPKLVEQLGQNGRLVIPIGGGDAQTLTLVRRRTDGTVVTEAYGPCVFVPLVGEHGWKLGGPAS